MILFTCMWALLFVVKGVASGHNGGEQNDDDRDDASDLTHRRAHVQTHSPPFSADVHTHNPDSWMASENTRSDFGHLDLFGFNRKRDVTKFHKNILAPVV